MFMFANIQILSEKQGIFVNYIFYPAILPYILNNSTTHSLSVILVEKPETAYLQCY